MHQIWGFVAPAVDCIAINERRVFDIEQMGSEAPAARQGLGRGLFANHERGRVGRSLLGDVTSPASQWATTDSNHAFNIAPNLLDQDFSADAPNQKWAGDISYIWTSEGWLYLAVILDMYSRRVIGWAPSHLLLRNQLPGNGSWVTILFQRISETSFEVWL